jgi:hypothetical protein
MSKTNISEEKEELIIVEEETDSKKSNHIIELEDRFNFEYNTEDLKKLMIGTSSSTDQRERESEI